MLLEITKIDDESVFVCECLECQRLIPVVESDMDDHHAVNGTDA